MRTQSQRLFQSSLPRGERQCHDVSLKALTVYFNPRSHEGSDVDDGGCSIFERYFNPRSHEGSDIIDAWKHAMKEISILAPTRGATAAGQGNRFEDIISILAPTRGATLFCVHLLTQIRDFNPRSHEGSDLYWSHDVHVPVLFQSSLPRGERPHQIASSLSV